jgi:hypothetical protein
MGLYAEQRPRKPEKALQREPYDGVSSASLGLQASKSPPAMKSDDGRKTALQLGIAVHVLYDSGSVEGA